MTGSTARSGLAGALPVLACPLCTAGLTAVADVRGTDWAVVGCAAGHRFDVARQGYVALLGRTSRTDTGDSADMVAARTAFLGAGHYLPIADGLAGMVAAGRSTGPVLEIGAGTGYYLGAVLDRLAAAPESAAAPVGVALDSSRYAARRAASAHPDIGSVVADAWSILPVRDNVIPTVLSVFAPRDPAEIGRVLAPGGRVLVVTPEPDHLSEIRVPVGLLRVDPGKPERLVAAFAGLLPVADRVRVLREMTLTRADITALARMGPAARHLRPGRLAASVDDLDDLTTVTLDVTISVLQSG